MSAPMHADLNYRTHRRIWTSAPGVVGNVLLPLAMSALPVSTGVGILKYRLYEIDRLISRTLSYALLTALLAGLFIGLIALTTDALALSKPRRCRGFDTRRRRAVQPAARPHPTARGSASQPRPLRRGRDRRGAHSTAARRGRDRRDPRRSADAVNRASEPTHSAAVVAWRGAV